MPLGIALLGSFNSPGKKNEQHSNFKNDFHTRLTFMVLIVLIDCKNCSRDYERAGERVKLVHVVTRYMWSRSTCGYVVHVITWDMWSRGICGHMVHVVTWDMS